MSFMKKKVLFICKYNVLRSKIAESYLKEINKNINVKSAGIISGGKTSEDENRVLKNYGFILDKKFNPISKSLIEWADIIIIIANDIPAKIFRRKDVKKDIRQWKIKDSYFGAPDSWIEKIITDIKHKVDKTFGEK